MVIYHPTQKRRAFRRFVLLKSINGLIQFLRIVSWEEEHKTYTKLSGEDFSKWVPTRWLTTEELKNFSHEIRTGGGGSYESLLRWIQQEKDYVSRF